MGRGALRENLPEAAAARSLSDVAKGSVAAHADAALEAANGDRAVDGNGRHAAAKHQWNTNDEREAVTRRWVS
jgi:hypothetical protein